MTRLHGFEDNSGGPPSGCRPVAALITRLSSQTACSSAEGRTSSHALAYHSLTNSSVMSRMGVPPNQGMSLSNAAFWIRLLLPLSSEPSLFRRSATYLVAYEENRTLPCIVLADGCVHLRIPFLWSMTSACSSSSQRYASAWNSKPNRR